MKDAMLFEYKGETYPVFLREGNAQQYVAPIAKKFCVGSGLDVGCGDYPLPGAHPIDRTNGGDAMKLPEGQFDYVFSSHCLEHLSNPVAALEHWKTRIKPGGVLFLYLPHPSQRYWQPANCRKHLHTFHPRDVVQTLRDLGFMGVLCSERDLAWSFSVVSFNGFVEVQA